MTEIGTPLMELYAGSRRLQRVFRSEEGSEDKYFTQDPLGLPSIFKTHGIRFHTRFSYVDVSMESEIMQMNLIARASNRLDDETIKSLMGRRVQEILFGNEALAEMNGIIIEDSNRFKFTVPGRKPFEEDDIRIRLCRYQISPYARLEPLMVLGPYFSSTRGVCRIVSRR